MVEEKISKIEVKLIEQEHRLFNVLENYFINRKKWDINDPRRTAATKALFWKIFFSPGTIAATGGIVATITLFVLFQQNSLFKEQNQIMSKQNQFFQTQIKQQEQQYDLQRRTDLISILYGDGYDSRTKSEALLEFVELEKKRVADDSVRIVKKVLDEKINLSGSNLSSVILEGQKLTNINFEGANFYRANLQAVDFSGSNLAEANMQSTLLDGAILTNTFTYEMIIKDSAMALTQGLIASEVCEMKGSPRSINVNVIEKLKVQCPDKIP